jgi:hypothetical protein
MVGFHLTAERNARDEVIDWLIDEYLRVIDEDERKHYVATVMYVFGKDSVIYDEFSRLVLAK